MELQILLQKIIKELDDVNITRQRRRYLESYKTELESYLNNHPDAIKVPSSFELFCDMYPEALECRKYDI